MESAFVYPTREVVWREHRLGVPLGLIVEEHGERGLRQLWIEAMFRPRALGSILVASATIAAAEVMPPSFSWVDTWHLRTGEPVRYDARDLRANWTRLDRMLATGEELAGGGQ